MADKRYLRLYDSTGTPAGRARDSLFRKLSKLGINFGCQEQPKDVLRISTPELENIGLIKKEVLEGKSDYRGFKVTFLVKGKLVD